MWPNLCFPPMEGILSSLHGNDICLFKAICLGGGLKEGAKLQKPWYLPTHLCVFTYH